MRGERVKHPSKDLGRFLEEPRGNPCNWYDRGMSPGLRVATGGVQHVFEAHRVTLGSGADDDVRISGTGIQPAHVVLTCSRDSWSAKRNGPPKSFFVDGRSKTSIPIINSTVVTVGSPDGPQVILQPVELIQPSSDAYLSALSAQQQKMARRLRHHTIALATVFGLLLMGAVAGLNAARIGDFFRAQQLEGVERATVRLVARDNSGEIQSWGSGTIVDSTGLIVTNAHVARPSAPGLQLQYGPKYPKKDPEFLEVWLTKDGADYATPAFRGHLVVADGWLDIAVVRIDSDKDGNPLSANIKFPSIDVGRRGGMSRGDTVYVVGYPELTGGEAQRISSGTVAAWLDENRVDGRRDILQTTANITGGNSGGAVVDGQGHLIAVPLGYAKDQEALVSAGNARPIEFALPLLEIARSSHATAYTSPYVLQPEGQERAELLGWSEWYSDQPCGKVSAQPPGGKEWLCVQFRVENMPPGTELLLSVNGEDGQWWVKELNGQKTAVFQLHLQEPIAGPLPWRLDIGGGAETLLQGTTAFS